MFRMVGVRGAYLPRFTALPSRRLSREQRLRLGCAQFSGTGARSEKEWGTIPVAKNEKLFYFDNVYPVKTAAWDIRDLITNATSSLSLDEKVANRYLPNPTEPLGFLVKAIVPRIKDGGAFLKVEAKSVTATEIEQTLQNYLAGVGRPWHAPWSPVKAFLVEGKPWVEDLYRFPSPRLQVQFTNANGLPSNQEIGQEKLYQLFRKYGKIAEITPPDPAGKPPKTAIIQFLRLRNAAAAKNCLHGLAIPVGSETVVLRVEYVRIVRTNVLKDWIFKHPRIVLPILALILTSITVAVFDPIREWFIEAKLTKALELGDNTYWRWLKSTTQGMIPMLGNRHRVVENPSVLLEDRKTVIEQIKGWLTDTNETFIVVQGSNSSGKHDVVLKTVLRGRRNVLVIDCDAIRGAHGDSGKIVTLASQVGYRPIFAWTNTLANLLDLAAKGTIGTETGFSQSADNQFKKILRTTVTALKKVGLQDRKKDDKDFDLSDDEYLSVHPEKRPVVVIDNFANPAQDQMVYSSLAEWAAVLVNANIAHVVFLTADTGVVKSLGKSLSDRVLHHAVLGDASPESARNYVLKQVEGPDNGNATTLSGLHAAIETVGGSLTELEYLARRIKMGESPEKAVEEIIDSAVSQILKLYFIEAPLTDKWTVEQAYYLVKILAEKETIPFNYPSLHPIFKSKPDDVISALAQAELISVGTTSSGRPSTIKAGKPVYRAAFRRLLQDRVFTAKMEMSLLKSCVKTATDEIAAAENELDKLREMQGAGIYDRAVYLVSKIADAQKKINDYEKGIGECKKVLGDHY